VLKVGEVCDGRRPRPAHRRAAGIPRLFVLTPRPLCPSPGLLARPGFLNARACRNPAGALTNGFSASEDNWGWMVGYGVEFALTQNWSAKAEYNYNRHGGFRQSICRAQGFGGTAQGDALAQIENLRGPGLTTFRSATAAQTNSRDRKATISSRAAATPTSCAEGATSTPDHGVIVALTCGCRALWLAHRALRTSRRRSRHSRRRTRPLARHRHSSLSPCRSQHGRLRQDRDLPWVRGDRRGPPVLRDLGALVRRADRQDPLVLALPVRPAGLGGQSVPADQADRSPPGRRRRLALRRALAVLAILEVRQDRPRLQDRWGQASRQDLAGLEQARCIRQH
jgi:hypothetical protein